MSLRQRFTAKRHFRHSAIRFAFLFILLIGCQKEKESDNSADDDASREPAEIHFVVIDDEPLAWTIERQVQARIGTKVVLQQMTADEFIKLDADQLKTDVIIYPSYMLGSMVERQLLLTIPKYILDLEQTAHGDVLPIERRVISRFGDRDLGFSLGSPSPVLLYREDLFRQLGLSPPKTWAEYQTTVDKLQAWHASKSLSQPPNSAKQEDESNSNDSDNGDEEDDEENGQARPIEPAATESKQAEPLIWSATCEPLQSEWAAQILLARSAAYIRKYGTYSTFFDIDSMEPLINREPYTKALTELAAAVKNSPHDLRSMQPADAKHAILRGECAMAVTWPAKGAAYAPFPTDQVVSIAELPGSATVYDFSSQKWKSRDDKLPRSVPLIGASGRLASVARSSQQSSSAFKLLALICGKEMIAKISPASENTSISRTSQLGNASAWIGPQYAPGADQNYAQAIERWNDGQLYLLSLRIPGREEYLQSLAEAVSKTLNGGDPQTALDETAARWREITNAHGLEQQKTAYLRSLGIKP